MKEGSKLNQKKLRTALIKKALGYDATEVIEEYVGGEEGEIRLSKKKVTKKEVPPDVTALKILLEAEEKPISSLSDEELENEKIRLLKMLSEKCKKEKI